MKLFPRLINAHGARRGCSAREHNLPTGIRYGAYRFEGRVLALCFQLSFRYKEKFIF